MAKRSMVRLVRTMEWLSCYHGSKQVPYFDVLVMAINTHGKSLRHGSRCRNPAIGGKVRGSGTVPKGSEV
jgi:hypothetical protein